MKLRSFGRWFIGILGLAFLILFALSNQEPVQIGLFPFGLSASIPLSVAILTALGLGFFLGGLVVWIAGFRLRRAGKRAEAALRVLSANPPASQGVAPRT